MGTNTNLSNSPTPAIENRKSKIENPPTPASPLRPFPIASSLTFADLAQLPPSPIPHSAFNISHSAYLPPGQLTLLLAHPATGKSLLALHIAAALSNGLDPFTNPGWKSGALASPAQNAPIAKGSSPTAPAPLPNSLTPKLPNSPAPSSLDHSDLLRHSSFDIHPSETLLLTADSPHLTILPRLQRLGADLTKIHLLAHFHSLVSLTKPTKQNPSPLRPLQLLEEFLDSHPNVRLIILDPILKFLGQHAARKDLTQITEPTSLLEKLMQLAEDRHITILATATLPHLNLADIDSTLAQNHLTRTIPNILLLAKDPRPAPNPSLAPAPAHNLNSNPNLSPLLLLHLKSPTALLPTIPLTLINGIPTFHSAPLERESPDSPSSSPYTDWYLESLSLTPTSLAAHIRAHRPPSPALAEAMAFLQNYLQDSGPIPFKKIAQVLAPNALAESTVREASRLMGIIKAPNLFQKNWVWHLKDDLRPFPGDPKSNPFDQQAKDRAKEQAFHAQQEKRRLQFAAQLMERESPDSPSSPSAQPQPTRPEQAKASGAQASACQTPQVQQNKPSHPTPTQKPTPQPPRSPIPMGPITP